QPLVDGALDLVEIGHPSSQGARLDRQAAEAGRAPRLPRAVGLLGVLPLVDLVDQQHANLRNFVPQGTLCESSLRLPPALSAVRPGFAAERPMAQASPAKSNAPRNGIWRPPPPAQRLDKGADPPSGGCCESSRAATALSLDDIAPALRKSQRLPADPLGLRPCRTKRGPAALTGLFLGLVQQAVLGGPDGGLGTGGQVQLAQDVGDVVLDR